MGHGHDSHDSGHGHGGHDDSPAAIAAHRRLYFGIFGALIVGTVVTVLAAQIHYPIASFGIAVALIIACAKSSLVAGFFMHLLGEVKTIWASILLTVFFFFVLILLPVFTESGNIGTHVSPPAPKIDAAEYEARAHGHGEDHGDEAHEEGHEAEAH